MRIAAVILLGLVLFSSGSVLAQETIDISKITCAQWMDYKITDPHTCKAQAICHTLTAPRRSFTICPLS